ncbi:MAG: hypothetical protein ACRD2C_19860 [Acidimicrobiales bacterium]
MSDLGWYGRTWYDRRQNERLEDISSALSYQRSESRRLTAQLSKVQGNMEQRLSRLASAFDAFVELSDLREELRAFQPAVTARHRARRVLNRLMATAGSTDHLPSSLTDDATPDMPGYWLPGAVDGLLATLHGDTTAAEASLDAARGWDAPRTDLFVCLALLLTDRVDEATVHLPALLDLQLSRPVTHAQRALWVAAADGRFGDDGRATAGQLMEALVANLPDGTRATQVTAWRDSVETLPGSKPASPQFPGRTAPPAGLLATIRAAQLLTNLADWYQTSLTASPPETAAAPSDEDPPDPLQSLLQELVDEGAPEEQPLLNRVAELHRIVQADGGAPPPAPTRWHKTLDEPLAMLTADARSADPGRRAIAVRAVTPILVTVADDLVAASRRPLPDEVKVQVGRHSIRFGRAGADPAAVAAIQTTFAPPSPPSRGRTQIGWWLIAAAAVIVLVGAFTVLGVGLALGGLVAAVGGWFLFDAVQARAAVHREQQHRQTGWNRTEQDIAKAGAALGELRAEAGRAGSRADEARERLDKLVVAETRA